MEKNKRSLLTALSSLLLTLVNGLFALVTTKYIILQYGSDFNGLNESANQFISMLLIVEGGFTIAANVALFKPMANGDIDTVNSILSATGVIFRKIGLMFFSLGSLISVFYILIINSEILPVYSFLIFFMTIISTFSNLYFATKYRILLQSENKEYILNGLQIVTSLLTQIFILITIFINGHFLLIRLSTMIGAILNSYLISKITKHRYEFIDFNFKPNFNSIKGTNDLFIQKITGMIYSTIPLLFISATVGTVYASVYIVYNNVFRLIKSFVYSFINAPIMSFGRLLAEKNKEYVVNVFMQYEYIVILILLTFLTTTTVLIMPFISIYIQGITDINYSNWIIAILLVIITFFEIIHIPSGNIINISGLFKVGRNIQLIACVVIIISMILGNLLLGFYGIIMAILITAIILGSIEIIYVHKYFFKNEILNFLKLLLPSLLTSFIIISIEIDILPLINSYIVFFILGLFLTIFNLLVFILVGLVFNRKIVIKIFYRILSIIKLT